jgi:hypothetical protein
LELVLASFLVGGNSEKASENEGTRGKEDRSYIAVTDAVTSAVTLATDCAEIIS